MNGKTNLLLCIAAMAALGMGCTKQDEIPATLEDSVKIVAVEQGNPLEPIRFSSADELRSMVESINSDIISGVMTKSFDPGFVSYAETVMQEDGYDDRENAIYSEAFGSILNPAGEVIFGDYMLKVCENGMLFSLKENIEQLRNMAGDIRLFE